MKNTFAFLAVLVALTAGGVATEAHASSFQADRVQPGKWIATYAGKTSFDNVEVVAILETHEKEVDLSNLQTLLPTGPIYKKVYRLTLIPVGQPGIRVSYDLRVQQSDGDKAVYVSVDNQKDLHFRISGPQDGLLNAEYLHKNNEGAILETGSFQMEPLLSVMN